ncbi:MAG: hypothetical protein ACP5HG_09175 [Anaerolineae bacterium]
MVRRFLKAYALELRLLVVHWSYPLLHILLLALLLTLAKNWQEARTALGTLETIQGRLAIGLISLLGLFAAGLSASRAERVKVAELEWTFPTGAEVTLARWLAEVTALLSFVIAPLIVAARQGPPSSLIAGLPTFVGETALTLAFTTAGAWWLARRIRLGRWAYPLLAAGWLGFLLGPTILVDHLPYFSLLNFMRQGTMAYHSELFRRIAYGDAFRWFNLFYVGLGLVFIAVLARRETRRRFRRPSLAAGGVALGGLLLAALATVNYIRPIAALTNGRPVDPSPAIANVDGLRVDSYAVTLDLDIPDRPEFGVSLTVRNDGPEITSQIALKLHPTLTMLSSDIAWDRRGATVLLELPQPLGPGESRAVQLHYAGPIWEAYLENGVPIAEVFAHPRGVRLTPAAAWYPRLIDAAASSGGVEPFSFHLTVTGNEDLSFAANIPAAGPNTFASDGATWIFLVGSPYLVTEQVGEATLVTARDHLSRIRPMISRYTDALAYLRRFMPEMDMEGLTVMVLEPGMLPEGTPPSDGRAVVVIGPAVLANVNQFPTHDFPMVWDALLHDLWQLEGAPSARPLPGHLRETARFLWMHRHCDGEAGCIAAEIQTYTAHMAPERREDFLPAVLLDLYEQGGEPAIVKVLGEFRSHPETFEAMAREDVAAWLREVSGAQ